MSGLRGKGKKPVRVCLPSRGPWKLPCLEPGGGVPWENPHPCRGVAWAKGRGQDWPQQQREGPAGPAWTRPIPRDLGTQTAEGGRLISPVFLSQAARPGSQSILSLFVPGSELS